MKNKNLFIRILTFLVLVCMSLALISCADEPSTGGGGDDTPPSPPSNFLVAEVGYDWEIPTPINISNYTATVKEDKTDGQDLVVENGKVHFDKVGDYILTYTNSSDEKYITVKVVDTEDPRFDKWWEGEWKDHWGDAEEITLKGVQGDTFDMSEYFKCCDNSGSVEVTYKVLRGGVDEVVLTDGKTFEIEETDFYLLTATAKDASNNYTFVKYKLVVGFTTVTANPKPNLGDADYGVKNNTIDYRHAGLYIGSPEGAKAGDKYNVTFKVKANFVGSGSQQMLILKGTAAGSPYWSSYDESIFVSKEYQTITVSGVCITTGEQFINRLGPGAFGAKAELMLGDVTLTDIGLFVFYYDLPTNGIVWVKDVEFTLVSSAPETPDTPVVPEDGEYSLTNANASYKHTGIYIGKPDGAQVGDKFNVTFNMNVGYDLTGKGFWVMQGTETSSNRAIVDVATLTQNEWSNVSLKNVAVTTGKQFKDHMLAIGFNANDFDLNNISDTYVGIFILNYVHEAGATISIKDVTFEKYVHIIQLTNNNNGYKHTGLNLGMPEGASVGDKFDVTFNMNVGYDLTGKGFWVMQGTETSSNRAIVDVATLTQNEWSNVSLKNVAVTTGKQFKDHMFAIGFSANDFDLNNISDTDVGIFMLNYTHVAGATIEIKEVTFEKAPISYTSITSGDWNATGTLIAMPEGAQRLDEYKVSFKLKVSGNTNANGWLSVYGDLLFRSNYMLGAANTDGWVDVSFDKVLVLTRADVKDWLSSEFGVANFPGGADSDLGIYVMTIWVDGGATIEIKDVVVTPV